MPTWNRVSRFCCAWCRPRRISSVPTNRGLEDHETQERKRLHRDVRSPSQRLADALKLGQVQSGGIFTAGLCLLLFPACATLLLCLELALFLTYCTCVAMNACRSVCRRACPIRTRAIPCRADAVLQNPKASSFSATSFKTEKNSG